MPASKRTTLYVDVTHTWASDLQTGMQKVVRQLTSVWASDEFDCQLVIYQKGRYLVLPPTSFDEIRLTYSDRNSGSINRKIIWSKIRGVLHHVILNVPKIKSLGFLQSDFALQVRKHLNAIPEGKNFEVLDTQGINLLILEIIFEPEHVDFIVDLAKYKKASLIFFSYDLIPINHPQYIPQHFQLIFQNYMRISFFSEKLWSISNTTQNELEAYVGNSKNFKQSIYQWLPPSRYTKCEHGLPFHLSGDCAYLLFVGSYEKRKNHLGFIEALRIIKLQGIEIPKVVFVGGTGWEEGSILDGIKNLSADGFDVEKLLNIPECCVGNLYQHALLTVYPSHFEGFGLPVVESLSFGVPVLTSNVGSTGELLELPGTLGFTAGNSNDLAVKLNSFLTNQIVQQKLKDGALLVKDSLGNYSDFGRKLYEFSTKE
jgi:glycosyltransferase involved in cell wall biosynthesis